MFRLSHVHKKEWTIQGITLAKRPTVSTRHSIENREHILTELWRQAQCPSTLV